MRRFCAPVVVVSLVVTAGACGGGDDRVRGVPTAPTVPIGAVTVQIVAIDGERSFGPNPATVAAGQTVVWRNVHNAGHRIVLDDGSAQTGILAPNTTSLPLTIRATVGYHCSIHPEMVGTIVTGQP